MDVCQKVHEAMLEEADCLKAHERLDFKLPPPAGRTWEAAYADHHVVVQRLSFTELHDQASLRDTQIVDSSVEGCLRHDACLALDKRVRFRENFIALGTQVGGRRGLVGSDLSKRHQVAVRIFEFICLKSADQRTVECVLGGLVRPMSHRPEPTSVLHRICKWKSSMPAHTVVKFPGDIPDELCIAVLFLAMADVDVRAGAGAALRATDAAPSGHGSCHAPCPGKTLGGPFRMDKHREEHVRLDWAEDGPLIPSTTCRAGVSTNSLFEQLPWEVSMSCKFKRHWHINLQEARTPKYDVRRMVLRDPEACRTSHRLVCGNDSCVVCGAVRKGGIVVLQVTRRVEDLDGASCLVPNFPRAPVDRDSEESG